MISVEEQGIADAQKAVDQARTRLMYLLRLAIERRDGIACHYCKAETAVMTRANKTGFPYHRQRTVDHVVPVSKGGKDTLDNVVIACRTCNSTKGNRDTYKVMAARFTDQRFRPGMSVNHRIFGLGVVVNSEPSYVAEMVTVRFAEGVRRVAVEWPVLEEVTSDVLSVPLGAEQ